MLRSIFEGYAPCVIIALLGYSAVGGSALAWLAFIWLFGAITTIMIAFVRAKSETADVRPRGINRMENC